MKQGQIIQFPERVTKSPKPIAPEAGHAYPPAVSEGTEGVSGRHEMPLTKLAETRVITELESLDDPTAALDAEMMRRIFAKLRGSR